ncbi:MAG: 16S rRNA (cytidine(1402)-2'-O)-methyltransferase [Clostridiaceae bacterium]|nr:16S rRNA (cytidine(1402)-2'-O)-methyltransferase [Clostridiaceae bacterium]
MKGKLYSVATPIGYLADISLRVLEVLKDVDLIAAEDTRHTKKLLNHFDINTPLTSYYEHKKREKGEFVLQKLIDGKNIALVSDAGMPGISDPGEDLVRLCIENNIELTVIPGATAFAVALVMSGLSTSCFRFEGFLTVKKTGRLAKLEQLKSEKSTLIFYEAPHKLLRTLNDFLDVFGDRKIAVCRELTKKYEEILRDNTSNIISHFEQIPPKGEFIIVVQGATETKPIEFEQTAAQMVENLINSKGIDKKEAIKQVAKQRGIPKREVYNEVTNTKFN